MICMDSQNYFILTGEETEHACSAKSLTNAFSSSTVFESVEEIAVLIILTSIYDGSEVL